jgi:hypothetical protein
MAAENWPENNMLSTARASQAGAKITELTPMRCNSQHAILIVALTALFLAGCASGGSRPTSTQHAGVTRVSLSQAQNKIVVDGVRQMVANSGAQLKAITATRVSEQPGVHVCGYVVAKDANGKDGQDVPFYVELRLVEGKPVAERGQVASDPSKLAKIKFVCRKNG